ncbi:MAG: bifunctional hydroxymethylpyrimidine kinase/phosphomethylpyrimidine kinase [Sediminicola sp.]
MKKYQYPSVLTIAGFDGSGGAGIQADIKTISALGCYATSVLTALPVQNTTGVQGIYPIPLKAVREQLCSILDDIVPQAIKIGMVHTSELVTTIVDTLKQYPPIPIVFDPVMVASSGHKLIEEDTVRTLVEKLFPLAEIITPNLDEAAILAERSIESLVDMYAAGEQIQGLGPMAVLIKGGHLKSQKITSLFFDRTGEVEEFVFQKYDTDNTHGSGCTLSSAIACHLALGRSTLTAVKLGQEYVQQAIYNGIDVKTGKGNGPLNHFFEPQKMIKNELVR